MRPVETATDGWVEVVVDLSGHAGKEIELVLANQANDWQFEAGYWAKIALESR